jgi:hypothetical protein
MSLATQLRVPLVALAVVLAAAVFGQDTKRPTVDVSPTKVVTGAWVMLNGTGFSPDRPVLSHLQKPDGSEYNPLRLRSNARGEIAHKIDTVMLDTGTFEAWVEDEETKTVSNRVRFTLVE